MAAKLQNLSRNESYVTWTISDSYWTISDSSPLFPTTLFRGYDLGYKLCPAASCFCLIPYPKVSEKFIYCTLYEIFVLSLLRPVCIGFFLILS